jgi:small subunit ribosomal protein S2
MSTAAPESEAGSNEPIANKDPNAIVVNDILEAGVQFGHKKSRWNPKMRPYIYGHRNGIHIIDLKETVRGLMRAKKYLAKVASQGSLILFVGTKRQASGIVAETGQFCGMPYVSERWLGGILTNFQTIRSRLRRLKELEDLVHNENFHSLFSKKTQSRLMREYKKIHRNLSGIKDMNRLPEVLVMVDPTKEHNAVAEARNLGIKVVALIDTDSDPDMVDLPIPGNDDSMRSIKYIFTHLGLAVNNGRKTVIQKDDGQGEDGQKYKAIPTL